MKVSCQRLRGTPAHFFFSVDLVFLCVCVWGGGGGGGDEHRDFGRGVREEYTNILVYFFFFFMFT